MSYSRYIVPKKESNICTYKNIQIWFLTVSHSAELQLSISKLSFVQELNFLKLSENVWKVFTVLYLIQYIFPAVYRSHIVWCVIATFQELQQRDKRDQPPFPPGSIVPIETNQGLSLLSSFFCSLCLLFCLFQRDKRDQPPSPPQAL